MKTREQAIIDLAQEVLNDRSRWVHNSETLEQWERWATINFNRLDRNGIHEGQAYNGRNTRCLDLLHP